MSSTCPLKESASDSEEEEEESTSEESEEEGEEEEEEEETGSNSEEVSEQSAGKWVADPLRNPDPGPLCLWLYVALLGLHSSSLGV